MDGKCLRTHLTNLRSNTKEHVFIFIFIAFSHPYVQRQEALAALEAKGEDESLGVVTRNKAKAELAQMKSRPSLEINRAKIGLDVRLQITTLGRQSICHLGDENHNDITSAGC